MVFFLIFNSFILLPVQAGEPLKVIELEKLFRQFEVEGTFVAFSPANGSMTVVNPERAQKRFIPASTFKIANSLIALETKTVADEHEIIPFGGKPQPVKIWQQDMSMRMAIKVSNVPVYQELARRIGVEKYEFWLGKLNYGNHQVGSDVETFWLKGPLKISAVEQAKFLAKLARNELPLSVRSQTIVSEITKLRSGKTQTLHAKTGWSAATTPQIGWFVGWISSDSGVRTFALNIDIHSKADAKKRKPLALALLKKMQILK